MERSWSGQWYGLDINGWKITFSLSNQISELKVKDLSDWSTRRCHERKH